MRKAVLLIAALMFVVAPAVSACDTACKTGYHWVWTNQAKDQGSCQPDPTPTPTPSTNTNTNSNSNSNANSNSNTNKQSQGQGQGQTQGQGQGQQQTATGGAGGQGGQGGAGGNGYGGQFLVLGTLTILIPTLLPLALQRLLLLVVIRMLLPRPRPVTMATDPTMQVTPVRRTCRLRRSRWPQLMLALRLRLPFVP